jgi:hypothetical protein
MGSAADKAKMDAANETIMSAQEKYRTETQYNPMPQTTGLQKVKSAASDAVGKVKDSSLIQEISKFSPLRIAGNVLGALLDGMLPEETNVQQLNKSYFNTREDGRIAGNPVTDLYAGMNRNSAFGNLETAGAKRIATREATIAKREKTNKPMSDKFKADTEKMKEQAKRLQSTEKAANSKSYSRSCR